jgi:hypothetical protein
MPPYQQEQNKMEKDGMLSITKTISASPLVILSQTNQSISSSARGQPFKSVASATTSSLISARKLELFSNQPSLELSSSIASQCKFRYIPYNLFSEFLIINLSL